MEIARLRKRPWIVLQGSGVGSRSSLVSASLMDFLVYYLLSFGLYVNLLYQLPRLSAINMSSPNPEYMYFSHF